jgi:hypothetical protein
VRAHASARLCVTASDNNPVLQRIIFLASSVVYVTLSIVVGVAPRCHGVRSSNRFQVQHVKVAAGTPGTPLQMCTQ